MEACLCRKPSCLFCFMHELEVLQARQQDDYLFGTGVFTMIPISFYHYLVLVIVRISYPGTSSVP
jgi:hypothetical protein